MRRLLDLLRHRLPGWFVEPAPDPFQTLELQVRLSRLAGELDALARTPGRHFATVHHSRAAMLAYEQTLDEACRLVGRPVPAGTGPEHRMLAEVELLQAGWQW